MELCEAVTGSVTDREVAAINDGSNTIHFNHRLMSDSAEKGCMLIRACTCNRTNTVTLQ